MEKKETLIERAIRTVAGFSELNRKLERKVKLNSLSRSTYYNYARSIAKISLHFKRTPLQLSLEAIEDYLLLQKQSWQPSESYFKHMVYGLRFLFRLYDRPAEALKLPVIQRSKKLPVILSEKECKILFHAPKCKRPSKSILHNRPKYLTFVLKSTRYETKMEFAKG